MSGEVSDKTQSRKWLLTINNPKEHQMTHEEIKDKLEDFSLIYWCMADEVGQNETYHTHVYMQSKSGIRFRTVKKDFPMAHIDYVRGTAIENRDYIFKDGEKYNKNTESGEYEYTDSKGQLHKGIHYDDTNEEQGDVPDERPGRRNDLNELYNMIKSGMTTYEIIEQSPKYIMQLEKIDRVRQIINEEKFADTWRTVDVTYIWGLTGTGKTRSVMDKYGYRNVYRVTDYQHPFDGYKGQDVIVFEEFRSSLPIDDMLKYLDGYPVDFPARYANKTACFTKVFIISNEDIRTLYPNVQQEKPNTWDAFLRRVNTIQVFDGKHVGVFDAKEYIDSNWQFCFGEDPFESEDSKNG